jgi:nephrocystin-4
MQAESYPALLPAQALFPQDFLLTYKDIIPGLRRFDASGLLTASVKSCISTLASPLLAKCFSLGFSKMQVVVSQLLHNLMAMLPQLRGSQVQ